MNKEKALWERLYQDEAYIELARFVGYAGLTYRELIEKREPLRQKFGNPRIDSATYILVTFEGERTVNPKPLAHVSLRPEVRKLCRQLLGPPQKFGIRTIATQTEPQAPCTPRTWRNWPK